MNLTLSSTHTSWIQGIERDGYAIVPGVFLHQEAAELAAGLESAMNETSEATFLRSRMGQVYAARNVLALWPAAATIWRRPPLPELLMHILGPRCGLVRALFFDKPPEQSWALPWHKDLTIAVRDNSLPSSHFGKPTCKAGIPHVEAPVDLLRTMLTLRLHLDEVTEANGPMGVIPGSHHLGKSMNIDESKRRSMLADRGDVLLIRPLVAHNSVGSQLDCKSHRRILHLEFAGWPQLPEGYAWHDFNPVSV